MRNRDDGSVWERAKLPSSEGKAGGKMWRTALGAMWGTAGGMGPFEHLGWTRGGGGALGAGAGNPPQPAGTPGWSRSPMDSPTTARGGGEFPKKLCHVERIHSEAEKKCQEREQWGTAAAQTQPHWAGAQHHPRNGSYIQLSFPLLSEKQLHNSHRENPAHKQV